MTRQGQILFSAYRAGDYADAAGFAIQLAAILSEFSDEVVIYVTSPLTGLQRRSKWPPTISEVLEACEQHEDYLRKRREHRPAVPLIGEPSPQNRPQGYLANVFVPEGNSRYPRLVEWTKTADPKFWRFGPSSDNRPGVWIPLNIWQEGVPAPPAPESTQPRDLSLTPSTRAHMGMEPSQEEIQF